MSRFILCSAWLLAALVTPLLAAEDDNLRHFRDLAETRSYTLGRPVGTQFTPDGRHALFLRSNPRDPVLRLLELELATGHERELLTPAQLLGGAEEQLSAEEQARRERTRQSLRGFTAFALSADATRLLVTLSGRLHVVDRASLRVTTLAGSGWIDSRFSPDGRLVAAVGADRELHVIDPATNESRAVTRGASATVSHGTSDFIAQEEMHRFRGYWWSPDSRSLLYQQTDESAVESRHIADPLHPEQAPRRLCFARAGTPNAAVRLWLAPLDGTPALPVTWDADAFPYLAHVTWSDHARPTLTVQNRTQTEVRLLAVDVTNGSTRELLRETDPAWVNLDDGGGRATVNERRPPLWFPDGSHFLWTTERRGTWQIELRAASGALVRELTPPDWGYHDLVGLDAKRGHVYARGGHSPREVHVWRFPLEGGPGEPLTREAGVHQAALDVKAGLLVLAQAPWNGAARQEVISLADGRRVATLPSVAAQPPAGRWPTTELIRVEGPRPLETALTRPRDFKPGQTLPVILHVYAGPGRQFVQAARTSYFQDQWLADQGFIVVRVDGRGTPGRGRGWERAIRGNFIAAPLEDQIAGLQALAAQFPELDLKRVGVTGWSFGGYFAAIAVMQRPDVFRAAVAGAPVATWENYTTHYTERYLGLPQDAPEAYRVSNVTTYASQLKRPLLLIHGTTDDNVYFQHTLQIAEALFNAGVGYELLPLSGTHMISEPQLRLRLETRVRDFFARELK